MTKFQGQNKRPVQIKDGVPQEIKGRWFIDGDGAQHPFRNFDDAGKLALGIHMVEVSPPEGKV